MQLQSRCQAWTVTNPGAPLAAGIGLDVGEPVTAEETRASEALNLAARLCSAAGAGEVLASRELMHLTGHLHGHALSRPRRLRLKGIRGRTEVVSVRPAQPDTALDQQFRAVLRARPATRRRRRQQRIMASLALVAALIAGLTAWQLAKSASNLPSPRIPGPGVGAVDVRTGHLLGSVHLDGSPQAIVASPNGRQVWVTEPAADKVVGIDTSSRTVFQTVPGLADPRAVVIASGYLWVVEARTGLVRQYDPNSGQYITRYPVGTDPSAITYGYGALWVTNQADGTVTRLTPPACKRRAQSRSAPPPAP